MNKYLIAVVMVVLAGVGYSQRSEAAACIAQTFSASDTTATNYLAPGFSCDIGDKTFSNFQYVATASGTAVAVAPVGVSVVPVGGPPFWGFQFIFGLAAGPGGVNDINITYTVTCNALAPVFNCITSNHVSFNGASTGTGAASLIEQKCLNGTAIAGCPAANLRQINLFDPQHGGPLVADLAFTGVHMETVNKDILVTGGVNGTAVISLVVNTVDQGVPEPATLALLGAGLASLAALRRRKASR